MDCQHIQQVLEREGKELVLNLNRSTHQPWQMSGELVAPGTFTQGGAVESLTVRISCASSAGPRLYSSEDRVRGKPSFPRTDTFNDSEAQSMVDQFTEEQTKLREHNKALDEKRALQQYIWAAVVVVTYYAFGVVYYSLQEDWSFVDSVYFVTVTLTTVGYGDLLPTSDASKMVTCAFVFIGIVVVATALGMISGWVIERLEALDDEEEEQEEEGTLLWALSTLFWAFIYFFVIIFGGAFFYYFVEDDNTTTFVDALYLGTITATTVGYGDFSPQTQGGRVFACFWILIGVACTAKAIGDIAGIHTTITKKRIDERKLKRPITTKDIEAYGGADGKLDENEFVICKLRAMGRITCKELDQFKKIFQDMDKDNGGLIDKRDLLMYAREMDKKGHGTESK